MASLEMNGPYPLTLESINKNYPENKPGNYALGYLNNMAVFIVQFVGRSDMDLNLNLCQHLDDAQHYLHFKAIYISDQLARYEKECHNYHDFGGSEKLFNRIHPEKPDGNDTVVCPICKV